MMTVLVIALVIWAATLLAVLALARMARLSDRQPEPPATIHGARVDEMTYLWDSHPTNKE